MQPRYLTPDEISRIVEAIPSVRAAIEEVGKKARHEIQKRLADQLKCFKLVPSGIELLIKDIIKQFYDTVIDAGTATGLSSSESLGAPIMQMTLNTFHSAGSEKSASTGIDGVKEVTGATYNMKHENITIHLRNKNLTYKEIYDVKCELTGLFIKELMSENARYNYTNNKENHEWWYPLYIKTIGIKPPESPHFLRVTLSKSKLYANKITATTVARKFMQTCSGVVCIASPISIKGNNCYLDIYPLEKNIQLNKEKLKDPKKGPILITEENAPILFLQYVVEPNLEKIIVKGIEGVKLLNPVVVPTWKAIKWEERVNTFNEDGSLAPWNGTWKLHLDRIAMLNRGISVTKIANLLRYMNIIIGQLPYDPDYPLSENPNIIRRVDGQSLDDCFLIYFPYYMDTLPIDIFDEPDTWNSVEKLRIIADINGRSSNQYKYLNPSVFINATKEVFEKQVVIAKENFELLVKAEIDSNKEEYIIANNLLKEKTYIYDSFLRNYDYIYLDGNGTKLKQVLAHPLIDPKRTFSNNWHEMNSCFGIVGGRSTFLKAYQSLIEGSGSYVNVRHLELLSDFQTSLGVILPVTATGASRQNAGAFAKASFSKALDAFKDAALFGKKEATHSTSSSIFLGKCIEIGTGYFSLIADNNAIEKAERNAPKINEVMSNLNNSAIIPEEPVFSFEQGDGDVHISSGLDNSIKNPILLLCDKRPIPLALRLTDALAYEMEKILTNIMNSYPPTTAIASSNKSVKKFEQLSVGTQWNNLVDLESLLQFPSL